MIEFIDQTSTQAGTKINRANLMAIQGFVAKTTTFNADGSITEKNASGETLTTTFNSNGTITEKFVGKKTITKITTFNANGTISETIS
jgi:YD repeat-containing protein